MATYKVRLIGESGHVLEEKSIKAKRNYDAVEAADTLCRAAARRCKAFEIWLYDRRIALSVFSAEE